MNDVTLSLTQRMQVLEKMSVGGAMVVTRGLGLTPAITLVSNVVSTRVDMADSAHLGAPTLAALLPEESTIEYTSTPAVPSHMFLGSLAHNSRTVIHSARAEWLAALLPVYLGPASAFAATHGTDPVCQVLFFPPLSEIPTGLFWPATISVAEFKQSLRSGTNTRPTVYGNFHYLMEEFSSMFDAWFNAVHAHPLSFLVRMEAADNLLATMPPLHIHDPDDPADPALVEAWSPLFCQVESFIQDACYDAHLCGPPPRAKKDQRGRMQLLIWLKRCQQCYPESFLAEVPIQRRPFLLTMFPLPENGADLDWTGPFEGAKDWPIPKAFAAYGSIEIPVRPTVPFTATRLELTAAEEIDDDDEDMDAYQKMLELATVDLPLAEKTTTDTSTAAANTADTTTAATVNDTTTAATVTPATGGRQNRSRPTEPPPRGTEFLEVPDSPIRRGEGVNTPSTTSFLQSLGHPQGILQQPAGSPFGAFGTPQGSIPFGPTVTPDVAGMAQWSQIAALAGLTQNLNEVLGSATPNGRRSKRFETVFKCTIRSALFRKRCDPSFLQGALLLAHMIQDVRPMYTATDGPIPSHSLMLVKEPTALGRHCFAGLDAGNNGSEAVEYIMRLMEYRASQSGPTFPFYGVLLDDELWSQVITPEWLAGAFKPSSWRIDFQRLSPRTGTVRPWHLLDFLPMVNAHYSGDTLPADGVTLEEAHQLGCLIYLLMSSIGVTEPARTGGDYDDSLFSNSMFGSVLLFMCRVPLNPVLKDVWIAKPRLCTGRWFTDMCELFNMVQRMVRHKLGASFATCGFEDAYFQGDESTTLVVVDNSCSADSFFGNSLTYVVEMQHYYESQKRFWAVRRFPTTEQGWTCAGHDVFFPTARSPFSPPNASLPPAGTKSRKRKADDDSTVKPPPSKGKGVTNTHPLFVSKTPDGGDPFANVLQKAMEIGDSPKILCPDTGKKRHQVCLRSAFVSCNTCTLPKWQCAARHKSKSTSEDIGRDRFHVDLSKKRWSASEYREENWNPIVEFVKKYKTHIGPSDYLKAVTPNTVWE